MSTNLKIAIAEPSYIIRCGLDAVLKRLAGFRITMVEITECEFLFNIIRQQRPDILIVNPSMLGCFTMANLKEECGRPDMKCVALLYSVADHALLRPYDEQFSIYDSADELRHKLERLNSTVIPDEVESDEQQSLSVREKEIVVCVVKGMTNREIADHLFLSTHTVITHRRNIARKLQIHSPSGLTVYAIVNKLVELGEIKTKT